MKLDIEINTLLIFALCGLHEDYFSYTDEYMNMIKKNFHTKPEVIGTSRINLGKNCIQYCDT